MGTSQPLTRKGLASVDGILKPLTPPFAMPHMPTSIMRVDGSQAWSLHDVNTTRQIERSAQDKLPVNVLMQRAGLATARLAMAVAPHAQRIWMACGPGNNGGDGLEAAVHLQRWGKKPIVSCTIDHEQLPPDARMAWHRANDAGVQFDAAPPDSFDMAIDALLGIGCNKAPEGLLNDWLRILQSTAQPVVHVDVPSGLVADTGKWLGQNTPKGQGTHTSRQRHTLSLLTLKPGLFTASGRDACGQVWFDDLAIDNHPFSAQAHLQAHPPLHLTRHHNTHKGSYGDVMVVGGDKGMTGAAILASMAALQGGAGRVYAGLLDMQAQHAVMGNHPALMVRHVADLNYRDATVVCGCGGGDAVRAELPRALSTASRLVLDADALNAIANDASLLTLLQQRHAKKWATVLTPHPLEAARLLNCSASDIQHDRLQAAQELASLTKGVVVLKGSGTVITQDGTTPVINHTGNARLATAGTGDVLAGFIGAQLANGVAPFTASCDAVNRHGFAAERWPNDGPTLTASELVLAIH